MKFRLDFENCAVAGVVAFYTGLFAFGAYVGNWEKSQPKYQMSNVRVSSIKRSTFYNDLHIGIFEQYRVKTDDKKTIYFPTDKWDETVKEGDLVDMVVKRNYPLLEESFDGEYITDYK